MQPLVGEERREFQRLRLDPPLQGVFGSVDVTLLEVGILGARITHTQPLGATYGELHFNDVTMKCEIVRTSENDGAFQSGIRFLAAVAESGDKLRQLLGKLVIHALELRRPAVPRIPLTSPVDGDKTIRGIDAQFLSYRFENGVWRKRRVFLPEQPAVGFTVAKNHDGDEIRRLCEVYQASDDEGRRLIRLFAELSVSDALEIPPRVP